MDEIGQGGYGSVSKALDKLTNEVVAIKFVRHFFLDTIQNKKVKHFKQECQVIEQINKFNF